MLHLEVSSAVRPLKWSLGVKWLTAVHWTATCVPHSQQTAVLAMAALPYCHDKKCLEHRVMCEAIRIIVPTQDARLSWGLLPGAKDSLVIFIGVAVVKKWLSSYKNRIQPETRKLAFMY